MPHWFREFVLSTAAHLVYLFLKKVVGTMSAVDALPDSWEVVVVEI